MSKIIPELEQQLKENPNQTFELIVRTNEDVTPHLEWLASAGFEIRRQYTLSPGAAVSCLGQDALKLLRQTWVRSVELDAPVHTMGS